MSKIKIGEVRYVESVGGGYKSATIASREVHNNMNFYRVEEYPGGLWMESSLHKEPISMMERMVRFMGITLGFQPK